MPLKNGDRLIQIVMKDDTIEILKKMAKEDDRTVSSLARTLFRAEWLRRHPEEGKIMIEEELERR